MNWKAAASRVRGFVTAARTRLWVVIVTAALVGAWLGLLVGGSVSAPVGPVETWMAVRPSWSGGTEVDVAPLGDLRFESHRGPLRLDVSVSRLNVADTESIVKNPTSLNGLPDKVAADLRSGIRRLVIKAAAFATLGALLAGFIIWRRQWRRALLTGAVAVGALAASMGMSALTWNPKSVAEPQYSGLLQSAPSLIGDARSIVGDFGRYSDELAKLVTNVSRLYDVGSSLPQYRPDPDTVRVLFVADIHLNPAAWDVIRSLLAQYEIDFVVDAGDLTDHGSQPENEFVESIGSLGVPYVFVRGNHDSVGTEAAVRKQPNALVLSGEPTEVVGFRITGAGDPRFTPNRLEDPDEEAVIRLGQDLARTVHLGGPGVDIAVVHDPSAARQLDGVAPLLLAGHAHHRSTQTLQQGSRLFVQGSTGGAGLRGIERDQAPTPIICSILYFDRTTKRLQAWDDITLGGLGESFATISRHVVGDDEMGEIPSPEPSEGAVRPPWLIFMPDAPPVRTPRG